MEYALADFPASMAVMTEQQPVVVSVADEHADASERALLEEGGYRTLLMLPLVSRGDSVGLLEIVDVADRVWNEHDLEFFRSLADIVGAAVHTALLNEQQREAENRYRSLVEHLPAVTYVDVAGTGEPVYVSPQLRDADGRARRGVDERPGRLGRSGCTRTTCRGRALCATPCEAGEPYSRRVPTDRRGRPRPLVPRRRRRPCATRPATARFIQGVIFEVTDQKEAEAQLRESEQRFRELLENVRLAAITTDLDGRIVFVNEYFAELSGWWDDELLGRSWVETFVAGEGSDGERAFLAELAQGHVIPHRESAILTRARETRLFSWNATPLRDRDGTVTGSAWIGEDITDRPQGRAGAGPPGLPRLADRAAQPHPVPGAPGAGAGPRRAHRHRGGRAVRRPGRLQARQRQLRARRRRRAAVRGRQSPAAVDALVRRGRPPGRRRVPDPDRRRGRRGPADARYRRGRSQGGRAGARGGVAADGAVRDRDLHQRQPRHQPVPGGRERRHHPAQARRHRDVQGQGVGPRPVPAVHLHRPRPAGAAVDGRPAARRRRARRADAALPADRRPARRRDRRRRGAAALAGRRPRRGHARRVHPAGRAHRPDRRAVRLGDRGGLPPGCALARAGNRRLRLGQPAGDLLAADRDAPGAGDDRVVRPVGGPDDDRDHGVHGDGRRSAAPSRSSPSSTSAACGWRSTTSAPATRRCRG